ncbi:MAG: hypothetical protein K0R34_1252 [Herbinix sp.]|jgi:hypothetical protein|nr:hypothetical protein [Herbinix sp.]
MKIKPIEKCTYCDSTNIGVGYQLGQGQLFADPYAYQSGRECSNIEHLLCKDCGSILHSRVVQTNMFHQYSRARQEELREYLDTNGILLCNENDILPSLCSLGYNMENIIGLIEQHQVFYCKAFKKRSTYLSIRAYQLLKRTKTVKELYPEAKMIFNDMKRYDFIDKEEFKANYNMEKKVFDKAFDFLLENLYITACAGKRLNPNWYSYLYCSSERFEKEIGGLHYNGNSKEALCKLIGKNMSEKDFNLFCK